MPAGPVCWLYQRSFTGFFKKNSAKFIRKNPCQISRSKLFCKKSSVDKFLTKHLWWSLSIERNSNVGAKFFKFFFIKHMWAAVFTSIYKNNANLWNNFFRCSSVLIFDLYVFKKTEFSAYAKFSEKSLKTYFLIRWGGCRRTRYFITAHGNFIRDKDFLLQSIFWTNAIHDFMHFKEMPDVFELMHSKKYSVRKKALKK